MKSDLPAPTVVIAINCINPKSSIGLLTDILRGITIYGCFVDVFLYIAGYHFNSLRSAMTSEF